MSEAREAAGRLDRLEAFVSLNGARFYGVEPSEETLTLVRGAPVPLPLPVEVEGDRVTVFDPGFPLHWRVE